MWSRLVGVLVVVVVEEVMVQTAVLSETDLSVILWRLMFCSVRNLFSCNITMLQVLFK